MENISNLILKSKQLLNSKSCHNQDKSNSKHPVAIIYLGEQAIKNSFSLKNALDSNWANSGDFINQLCVSTDKDGNIVCYDIKHPENTDSFQKKYSDCIRTLLETPDGIFHDKSKIKVEFVISTDEERFADYLKEIAVSESYFGLTFFRSLYVMLNQSDSVSQQSAQKNTALLWEHKDKFFSENIFSTIFFLSNYLSDKSLLSSEKLYLNYRLVADIILLGGNSDDTLEFRRNILYGNDYRIKTASYTLVEKPSYDITVTTLLTIIDGILFTDFTNSENRKFEVYSALGINMNKVLYIEDFFNSHIRPFLPVANDFISFPYNEKLLKECKKDIALNHNPTTDKINKATFGVWNSFYNYNCAKLIEDINIDEFKEGFKKYLLDKFTFNEFIDFFGNPEVCNVAEKCDFTTSKSAAKDFHAKLSDLMCNMAKNDLYAKLIDAYKQTVLELHNSAKRFKDILLEIKNDIGKKNIIRSGIYESIFNFYTDKTSNFLTYTMKNVNKYIDFSLNREQILDKLYEIFSVIIEKEPAYSLPFEKELSNRLENAGHAGKREQIIREALVDSIGGKVRLNTTAHLKPIWQSYLGNVGADFINSLKSTVDGDVNFFDINRSDSLENIRLFKIDDSGDLII